MYWPHIPMGYCRVVMEQLQYQHIHRYLFKSHKSYSVECCGRNAVITSASDASENSSEGHCEGKQSMQWRAKQSERRRCGRPATGRWVLPGQLVAGEARRGLQTMNAAWAACCPKMCHRVLLLLLVMSWLCGCGAWCCATPHGGIPLAPLCWVCQW